MTSRRARWPRTLAAVAAGVVLLVTVVGAGVTTVMGQLQGNITAVDVSEQLGLAAGAPSAPLVVDEATGDLKPVNVLLMGSDTRSGKGNGGFGSAAEFGGERSDTTILLHISADLMRLARMACSPLRNDSTRFIAAADHR